MPTEKLYYASPYAKNFSANIISAQLLADQRWGIILDKTLFYPESGGQPFDTGTINNIPVVDVQEKDDYILHILPEKPANAVIQGCLHWNRRFDHMQQHTGQHILSAAFLNIAQAKTVGFHLGSESAQIDLAADNITIETINKAEKLANKIIYANLSVTAHDIGKDKLSQFPIRKIPEKEFDTLRMVQIGDCDYSLCCGTHVSATGEIGIIKIRGFEKKNNALRIDFVCGYRALADYQQKNSIIQYLSASLSAPLPELITAYDRQQTKFDTMNKQLLTLKTQLSRNLAHTLHEKSATISGQKAIVHVLEEANPSEVSVLAKELLTEPQSIVLLAGINPEKTKAHLIFSTNSSLPVNMNNILKAVLPLIEGKGGGNAQTAQGGGNNLHKLPDTLAMAKNMVLEQLK